MLNELSPNPGSRSPRKRVGRGPGSGKGKTCGTGVKGQGTRSGKKIKPWFEGGQMPLYQRVPKKGFQNRFRVENEVVNLAALAVFGDNAEVDVQTMVEKGLVRGSGKPVKVLAEGDAPKGLKLKVNKISASAQAKIEAAGEGAYKITGMLKMHGVEKEVTAKGKLLGAGKDPWGNTRVGLEADFKVDRLAYGVDYMPEGLGKEVMVTVAIEGILEK